MARAAASAVAAAQTLLPALHLALCRAASGNNHGLAPPAAIAMVMGVHELSRGGYAVNVGTSSAAAWRRHRSLGIVATAVIMASALRASYIFSPLGNINNDTFGRRRESVAGGGAHRLAYASTSRKYLHCASNIIKQRWRRLVSCEAAWHHRSGIVIENIALCAGVTNGENMRHHCRAREITCRAEMRYRQKSKS